MQIDEHISYRGIIVFFLLGLGLLTAGYLSKKQAEELNAGNQTVEARITNSQVTEKKGKKSYSVKYAFKPSTDGAEVTRCDYLGRKDLWSSLSEADYKTATGSGKILVRYATSNPSNNEPATHERADQTGDMNTAVILGAGALLIGTIGLVRKRRAEKAAA